MISAPSWKIVVEVGGMDPGSIPPISAWWARDAVKKIIWAESEGLKTVGDRYGS